MIRKVAKEHIDNLAKYIAANSSISEANAERFIHIYLGSSTLYEIAKVQNPYADIADTASKIILYSVENRDNLIDKAIYYNVDELVCTFFDDLKPLDLALKAGSGLGDTIRRLQELYTNEVYHIKAILYDKDSMSTYIGANIDKQFGKEYTLEFVTMIAVIIIHELKKSIDKQIVEHSFNRLTQEIEDFAKLDKYGACNIFNYYSIGIRGIINIIGHSVLFKILDYRFLDREQWPFKGSLIDLLNKQLEGFKFNSTAYNKLKMINCDSYKGIDLPTASYIMILKYSLEQIS